MNLISFLLLILTHIYHLHAQSQCAAKAFPPKIPMQKGQSQLVDLQDYFQGNNISFSVTPSNAFSRIDKSLNCQQLYRQDLGQIVSSKYIEGEQIIATLSQSITGRYTFSSVQVQSKTISTIDLPNDLNYSNCTDFQFAFLNSTHFQIAITCKDTNNLNSRALLSTVTRLNQKDFINWNIIRSPQYSYTQVLTSHILLLSQQEILIRSVSTSANSYIQIWTWNQQYKQIIGIIDKTILGVQLFNLKSFKLYDSILILLDYHFGLHILRINKSKKIQLISQISQPFFEEFSYDPASGLLLLAKKGKVVSAVVKNLRHSNIAVGMSFNLFNYRKTLKVADIQNKLIVLDDSLLNVFSVNGNQNAYKHYNFYPSDHASNFFIQETQGQSLTLFMVKNPNYNVIIQNCTLRSPILHLSAPPLSQQVKVTGKSVVNDQTSICQQNFTLQLLSATIDKIYNNGYFADNQLLFANLPGQGVIQLVKYGVGRNLQYQITTNPNTKLQYTNQVRKNNPQSCKISSKPIQKAGDIYFYQTWENILLLQLKSDMNLRYFICDFRDGSYCQSQIQIPNFGPIDDSSYQLLQKTNSYSISLEILLQQHQPDYNILVRKIIIQTQQKIINPSYFCTITIPNYKTQFTNITQIQVNNGLLYVVMPWIKQIRIYDLSDQDCPNINNLNIHSFPKEYFSPREIFFDNSYNNYRQPMLFVKQWNELLSIKLQGSSLKPVIINRNTLPQSKNGSAVISLPYVLYFSFGDNLISVYRLDDHHTLLFQRNLILGQDIVFASSGQNKKDSYQLLDSTHLAIKVLNQTDNRRMIKIFNFQQLISGTHQYSSTTIKDTNEIFSFFHLTYSHKSLILLQLISESSTNFFICQSYDIYLQPSVLFNFTGIRSTIEIYSENVTLTLRTKDDEQIHQFQVSLTNLGQGISRGNSFPGRGTSFDATQQLKFNDANWFKGSIYNYNFSCRDCKDRIKFRQKIQMESKQQLPFTSSQFFLNHHDQILHATANSFLVQMQYNFSAWPINQTQQIPDSKYQLKHIFPLSLGNFQEIQCIDSIMVPQRFIVITLCWRYDSQQQKQFFISLVSTVTPKTFVLAQTVVKFQDNVTPKLLYNSNIIVAYSLNIAIILTIWDIQNTLTLVQLDQIDRQDIADKICAAQLISNDTSPHTDITKILYNLVITQCNSQLYYTSFAVYLQQQQIIDQQGIILTYSVPNIHVNYGQNINLPKLWSQKGIQIPSQAQIIQTITQKQQSHQQFQQIFSFLILFDRFHSYQFKMTLSKQNRIVKTIVLQSVFFKHGSNIAKSAYLQDVLAIKYVLDSGHGKMGQLYGLFNLSDYTINPIQLMREHYHFAAYQFNTFRENQVREESQQSYPWFLDGNRIFQLHHQHLQVLNISSQLVAHINNPNDPQNQLYSQSIVITANNPSGSRSATIKLKAIDQIIFTSLQIALIVVAGIILVLVIIIVGRILIRKLKKRLKLVPLTHHSNAEDEKLQWQQQERAGQWRLNLTERGSAEPE